MIMAALGGYFSAVMLLGDNRRFLSVIGDPPPLEPFSLGMAILVGIFSGLLSSLYVYLVGAGPGWVKKNECSTFFSTFNSCNSFVRNFSVFSSTHWSWDAGC